MNCPTCSQPVDVEGFDGCSVRCPHCHVLFDVPAVSMPTIAPRDTPVSYATGRRHTPTRSDNGLLLGGLVLVIGLQLGTLVLVGMQEARYQRAKAEVEKATRQLDQQLRQLDRVFKQLR